MARKQDENLIPNSARTPSERRENATKAGIASGKARRQKKTVAEYLQKWADSEVSEKNKKALEALGLSEEATNRTLLVVPLIKKASSGDTKALQMALELLGEDKKKELDIVSNSFSDRGYIVLVTCDSRPSFRVWSGR